MYDSASVMIDLLMSMLIYFVQAFGCHTTVFSRGTGKKDSVMNDLKADAFIDSTNADEMKVGRDACLQS